MPTMTKPKKPQAASELRTRVINVRLTESETAATKALAASRGQTHASLLAWLIRTHPALSKGE